MPTTLGRQLDSITVPAHQGGSGCIKSDAHKLCLNDEAPGCRDTIQAECEKHGLDPKLLQSVSCFNTFMVVDFASSGEWTIGAPLTKAGDSIDPARGNGSHVGRFLLRLSRSCQRPRAQSDALRNIRGRMNSCTSLRWALCVALIVLVASFNELGARDPRGIGDNGFDSGGAEGVPPDIYKPGKKVRESDEYKKENKDPAKRKYYENGGKTTNTDDKCRAKLAYLAGRYSGPRNGYDGTKPKPGGGKYADKFPTDPKEIIKNIYKFVEDVLYPRKGSNANWFSDRTLCDAIINGGLDIGAPNPNADDGFACIVAAHLFTSLVRELGFPAREKNVLPSTAEGRFRTQTAAANVYFGGKWHFFDPWESFDKYKDYLREQGHAASNPDSIHDMDLWVRTEPPAVGQSATNDYEFALGAPFYGGEGWKRLLRASKNGSKIIVKTAFLRLGVEDSEGRYAGAPSERETIALADAIYVPHDELILATKFHEPGPEMTGYELVTLIHPEETKPGTYDYIAILSNPTGDAHPHELEIEAMPVSVAISDNIEEPARGVLRPGEAVRLPFSITVGAPLDLPPKPVDHVVSTPLRFGKTTIRWTPVADAVRYQIYRSADMIESLPDSVASLISETKDTSLTVSADRGDVIAVIALNAAGLASGLDPEAGSTTVASPAKTHWLWFIVIGLLALIALIVLLYKKRATP